MKHPLFVIVALLSACAGKDDTAVTCPAPVAPPTPMDLDADGFADLVFAQTEDASGSYATTSPVFWGGADGFSTDRRTDLPTLGADDVEVADLDGDGWLDLVFAAVGDGKKARAVDSLVYPGGPDGFDPARAIRLPTIGAAAVTVHDLDGDGFADLFFSNRYDGGSALDPASYAVNSRLYWGGETGPSDARYRDVPTIGAADARFADLDRDGHEDLVVASGTFHVDESRIYWGSDAGFSDADVLVLPTLAPEGVEVADLDGDGALDVFFANFYDIPELDVDSALYPGSARGPSPDDVTPVPTHGATDARAVDVDADGCLDLVVAQSMEGTFFEMDFVVDSVLIRGGPGGLTAETTPLPTVSAAAVDAADLDADGDIDLVFANRYDPEGNPAYTSRIYWNDAGFDADRFTDLPTVGAAGVAARVSGD